MTKLEEVSNIATKYFLKPFYVHKDIMFLIGYFIDNEDIGYIFLNHHKEKVYIPSYVQIHFAPLTRKIANELIYGYIQDVNTNKVVYLARHNADIYSLDFIQSKEDLMCFSDLLINISNYITNVLSENYTIQKKETK